MSHGIERHLLVVAFQNVNGIGELFLEFAQVFQRLGTVAPFVDDVPHQNEKLILVVPVVFNKSFQGVHATVNVAYHQEIHVFGELCVEHDGHDEHEDFLAFV